MWIKGRHKHSVHNKELEKKKVKYGENQEIVNQGRLEVVKQEMAIVNIDILGLSELKWTGMGEFNSDDH